MAGCFIPFEPEMWKQLILCGSRSTLIKQVRSKSELRSESVEKELEAEATFKLATTVGVKCNSNNDNKESATRAWYGMENDMEILMWNMEDVIME